MFNPSEKEYKEIEILKKYKGADSLRDMLKRELGKQARLLMNSNDVNSMLKVQGVCQTIRDLYKLFDIDPTDDVKELLKINKKPVKPKKIGFIKKIKNLIKKSDTHSGSDN